MPWYSIVNALPGGRRELVVLIKCADDADAADDLSADMFPGAQVWQGRRLVAVLPPPGFPRGDTGDRVVTIRQRDLVQSAATNADKPG